MGREECSALKQRFDSLGKEPRRTFWDHTTNPGRLELRNQMRVRAVNGKNDHGDFRRGGVNCASRLQAVHLRHAEIEYHQIGTERRGLVHSFETVARFATDFPSRMRLKKIADGLARFRMIVSD